MTSTPQPTPSRQHQVLAVEPTRQAAATRQMDERQKTFANKASLYHGQTRILRMFGRTETNSAEIDALEAKDLINTPVQATVRGDLNYMAGVVGSWWDTLHTKELTNQTAKADVVVDGVVVIANAPAVFLLGLENKLKRLREVYDAIPTLPPGFEYVLDPESGAGVYKLKEPIKDVKVVKATKHVQLKQSTDKHPDTWVTTETTENIGEYTNQKFYGVLSVADKAALLLRYDKFLMAVKDARQRANDVQVVQGNSAEAIFRYLHGDMFSAEIMKSASAL